MHCTITHFKWLPRPSQLSSGSSPVGFIRPALRPLPFAVAAVFSTNDSFSFFLTNNLLYDAASSTHAHKEAATTRDCVRLKGRFKRARAAHTAVLLVWSFSIFMRKQLKMLKWTSHLLALNIEHTCTNYDGFLKSSVCVQHCQISYKLTWRILPKWNFKLL